MKGLGPGHQEGERGAVGSVSHLPLGLDALHLARRLFPDAAAPPQRQTDPHVGKAHTGERQDVRQHHQHHSVSGGEKREGDA